MQKKCCEDLDLLRDLLQLRIRVLTHDIDASTMNAITRARLETLRSVLKEVDRMVSD